jgi:hypothetical protein
VGSYEDLSSWAAAPEILQQESRILEQLELIERLEAAGQLSLSKRARAFLAHMCSALVDMRLEERRKAIWTRELSFVSHRQGGAHDAHGGVPALANWGRL